jgi:hypothetical protein
VLAFEVLAVTVEQPLRLFGEFAAVLDALAQLSLVFLDLWDRPLVGLTPLQLTLEFGRITQVSVASCVPREKKS